VGWFKEEKPKKSEKTLSTSGAKSLASSHGYSLEACRKVHGFWQVFDPRWTGRSFPCAETASGALEVARKNGAEIPSEPEPKPIVSRP